ncbi:hypothetical protein KGF56_004808 [Candida oxycetoniae]|uniref:Mmc1 C-terminal domain-containing protein n=1 Tax=Candida oxycetoniae TaxID=497107 RepID=A0AAI9SSL3_9ASCO|nr:uncharacterized protein KGF56_004808 [Candida oxycetoniae]KAI3402400.2 hypothetical protein KGF56_004808 [Candida oxycetoniae]
MFICHLYRCGRSIGRVRILQPHPAHFIQCLNLSSKSKEENNNTTENTTLVYNLNNYQSSIPQDLLINKQIETLKKLLNEKYHRQTLKVGILYKTKAVRHCSKIVEILLADPLASNSNSWFEKVVNRHGNGHFTYNNEAVEILDSDNQFKIPSPVLSGIRRTVYDSDGRGNNANAPQNDLILEELDSELDLNTKSLDDFTFLLYVTNQFESSTSNLPLSLQNKLLLQIIDNVEYTPSSTSSSPLALDTKIHTHVVKINSQMAYEGIRAFIEKDVEATDVLIDNLIHSNVYQLFKFVDFYSSSHNICQWYLDNIVNEIRSKLTKSSADSARETQLIQEEIPRFVQLVNTELQYKFEPATTKFIHNNLSWWKLYYKNDNVEYDLKDFFNEHFMDESIETYNFLRGRILSTTDENVYNPLLEFKNDVINKRISDEIQPMVYSIISKAFVYYQLPISIISAFAYQFFEFSANASIALLGLGWVVGFNYVSRNWLSFMDKWLSELVEQLRVCLGAKCIDNGLLKETKLQIRNNEILNETRRNLLQGIEKYKNGVN